MMFVDYGDEKELAGLVSKALDRHPDRDAGDVAALVVNKIPTAKRREILVRLVESEVEDERRRRARRVEEEARRQAVEEPRPTGPPKPVEPEHFPRLYDDPTLWAGRQAGSIWFNAQERKRFTAWCESRRADEGGFDAWLARGLQQIEEDSRPENLFRPDWVPGYVQDRKMRMIDNLLKLHAEQIRFEVTAELLDSVFRTGDGTEVSWREATVAQHEQRIELLSKMVAGTAETAAMHMRAVEMIKDAGAETLGQVAESVGVLT